MLRERTARGSILVAEDDECHRALVAETLRAAGYDVLEAASGTDAVAATATARPDAVLLDVVLPGLSGYEVCHRLRDRFGDALPIMFMSGERVECFDRTAGLLVGADDYLVKPFDLEELLALVHARTRHARNRSAASRSNLTARQLEVLQLLGEGMSPNEIAEQLVISPKTVGAHIEHLFVKLGVHTRAQAVAFAYREHLVSG